MPGRPRNGEIVAPAPRGWERLRWVGPAIIWMVSAIATGELLFTPRVAALYGYALLWTMALALLFKTMIAREIGRYAVVTGGSLLRGIRDLPGPRHWGVWFILVPQLAVAALTITGMAAATGTAVILLVPGDLRLWAAVFLALSLALVLLGRYRAVEGTAVVMSIALTLALVTAAAVVFPGPAPLARGLAPTLPADLDYLELLPWLGFMMSGAAGLIWYSYWLVARGYGTAHGSRADDEAVDLRTISTADRRELHRWVRVMTAGTVAASTILAVLLVALMVLGAELLRPAGLVPAQAQVTEVLSRLFGEVWGTPGRLLMVVGALIAFWSTMVANLDGWGRMLSQGSVFVASQFRGTDGATAAGRYRLGYLLLLMGVLPAALFTFEPDPFAYLAIAGTIEAAHIPFVALAVLYLNLRRLPPEFRPSPITVVLTGMATLFFLVFAVVYLVTRFD